MSETPGPADGPFTLDDPPASLADTRRSLHRLAAYVIAPTRYRATERFGLRWAPGGFATPLFPAVLSVEGEHSVEAAASGPGDGKNGEAGADRRIRVDGTTLVDEQAGQAPRTTPITTLAAAASWLGAEIDPTTAAEPDTTPLGDVDAPLDLDEAAARFLGNWYGVSFAALEALHTDPDTVAPSEPQLWPGHFDVAIEAGDEDHRASYGASPGDGPDGSPYLYVSVWWPARLGLQGGGADAAAGGYWNAATFTGRQLPLADFPAGEDPLAVARIFFLDARDHLDALASSGATPA